MGILTRETLLQSTDLKEKEVELPTLGGSVVVRSLPAAYSNEAHSEAMELVTVEHNGRAQQTMKVNSHKLEVLKVLHGLVEPQLDSIGEVHTFAKKCGRAWHTVVKAIDDLSGIDADAVERAEAMFQPGRSREAEGSGAAAADADSTGNGGPVVPMRVGA